jgi:hypothetical protein
MIPAAEALLDRWANFYVIIGSSAGALTGLQFVVMALISETRPKTMTAEVNAFGTPTVVHFCVALLVSAIMSAPWPSLAQVSTALVLTGSFGIGYVTIVAMRARRTKEYRPVLEDWIWYTIFPFLANAAIFAGATMLLSRTTAGMFVIGAGALGLVFIGIHNAWDSVTFLVTTGGHQQPE